MPATLASEQPAKHRRTSGWSTLTMTLLLLTSVLLFAIGRDFYLLDMAERVHHPDYRVLSPSAPVGHGYGIVGSMLILTNLSYLVRRRFSGLDAETMRIWLNMHVLTGLVGSVLILFHSTFQLRNAVAAVTALSLALVVGTGLVGRYIHRMVPKQPDAATLQEDLRALDRDIRGLGSRIYRDLLDLRDPSRPHRGSLIATMRLLPTWRLEHNDRTGVVDRARGWAETSWAPAALPAPVRERLASVRKLAALPVQTIATVELLRAWRVVHRSAALFMLLSVTVHVAAAWVLGLRWLFSG